MWTRIKSVIQRRRTQDTRPQSHWLGALPAPHCIGTREQSMRLPSTCCGGPDRVTNGVTWQVDQGVRASPSALILLGAAGTCAVDRARAARRCAARVTVGALPAFFSKSYIYFNFSRSTSNQTNNKSLFGYSQYTWIGWEWKKL
jgi:hypothetical protein